MKKRPGLAHFLKNFQLSFLQCRNEEHLGWRRRRRCRCCSYRQLTATRIIRLQQHSDHSLSFFLSHNTFCLSLSLQQVSNAQGCHIWVYPLAIHYIADRLRQNFLHANITYWRLFYSRNQNVLKFIFAFIQMKQ